MPKPTPNSENNSEYPPDLYTAYTKIGEGAKTLNVTDATKIGKYQFSMRTIGAGGKATDSLQAYIDVTMAKAWALTYIAGTTKLHFPEGFQLFGGSSKADKIISRSISIKPAEKGGIILNISEAPGVKTATGAIMPAKDAKEEDRKKQMLKLGFTEAIKLATIIATHQPHNE